MIRLAATWLLVAGVIWMRSSYLLMQLVSGRPTGADAVLLFLWCFAGPILLLIAAGTLLARLRSRISVVILAGCVLWLTWSVVFNYWPQAPEKNAIAPVQYDWLFVVSAVLVLVSIAAVVVIALALRYISRHRD